MLCLHNKPTLTPKDSMRLQCSTKHYTTNKTTIAFEVFNVGFTPTSSYMLESRKKVPTLKRAPSQLHAQPY